LETVTNSATILIVNHHPLDLEILDRVLSYAGYNVQIEVKGINVIQQVRVSNPDLILLDITRSDISGFEVCKQIKDDPLTKSIPVIFIAASTDTVDKVQWFSMGAVDYITKPFVPEEILIRIRTHLNIRKLSKSLAIQEQKFRQLTEELENKVAKQTAELQQALAKERELNQLKSRFISMASHEFRTPLAIISSSSGILQKFSDRLSEEKKQHHLETVQKTIKHITNIIDDVLMISRAETDNVKLQLQPLDIIAFCYNLQEEIENSSPQYHINLSLNSDEEIFNSSLIIQADKKLLQQILTNLLTNAIKYSPENHLVEFSLTITNNQLIFQISDSGIGIPEADQMKLFASFHRGSNVGEISGTGLGLSIVKKCVDLYKGEITVDSQLGKGTTFTVIIPFLKPT
jgi:two-component system sensor histidine kinase/response regulator